METLPTPCYIVDERLLIGNLKLLREVADACDCKILLAQKAFSMFAMYPLISEYLDGATASGLHEALLADEYMKTETIQSADFRRSMENHVFSAAYSDEEFDAVLPFCEYIVFNSFSQWERFKKRAEASEKNFGIRINPEVSTQGGGIYDPCALGSRLGVTQKNFLFDEFERSDALNGIHFHTLCQQNSDALEETLNAVEKNFSQCLKKISWLNMGGGHHITRKDYDVEKLVSLIRNFKNKYEIEIYLEPGEAVALNAGFLMCTVLDVIENDGKIAILDASAACHMPDVLEMPYRPQITGAGKPGEFSHTYRLGGSTCLAGDFIGEYSFKNPISPGKKIIFEDMAIYSMVKNTTFNGINLPAIAIRRANGNVQIVRRFGYEDFKNRLS
jgi:carboxynorspermidine decarboxylase